MTRIEQRERKEYIEIPLQRTLNLQ